MNGVLQAVSVGAILAVAIAAWVGVGYFIQKVVLKNQRPGSSAIITSMVASMIVFAIAAIWFGLWNQTP